MTLFPGIVTTNDIFIYTFAVYPSAENMPDRESAPIFLNSWFPNKALHPTNYSFSTKLRLIRTDWTPARKPVVLSFLPSLQRSLQLHSSYVLVSLALSIFFYFSLSLFLLSIVLFAIEVTQAALDKDTPSRGRQYDHLNEPLFMFIDTATRR